MNLTLEFARVLTDLNNAFASTIGQVGLPGYERANAAQKGIALLVVAIPYAVMALLLVFQMPMRLALLDVLIVLWPLMVLCWVLPQTQGWTLTQAQLLVVVEPRVEELTEGREPTPLTRDGRRHERVPTWEREAEAAWRPFLERPRAVRRAGRTRGQTHRAGAVASRSRARPRSTLH